MRTHSLKRNANVSLLSVFKLVIHCITTFLHLFFLMCSPFDQGAAVAVIVWQLDLLLPMQSVPITTDSVSSNLDQIEVYNIM
jgi:hypothetical protein